MARSAAASRSGSATTAWPACLIAPRSGLGHRGLVLGNTVGILDADYEGPVLLSLWNREPRGSGETIALSPGDGVAQLVFVRTSRPVFTVVESVAGASARGAGGFGSTGVAAAGGRP